MFKNKDYYKSAPDTESAPPVPKLIAISKNNTSKNNKSNLFIGKRDESERETLLKELSDPYGAAQMKAISSCLELIPLGLSCTLLLWCLGLGAVMILCTMPQPVSYPLLENKWVLFTPFWLGDIVAFCFQFAMLARAYLLRFLTQEQQNALRQRYGSMNSPDDASFQSQPLVSEIGGFGVGPLNLSTAVDVAYMPLVQRTALKTAMSIPVLLILVVQQILVCLELSQYSSDKSLRCRMLVCFFPILFLQVFELLRVFLIRTKTFLPLMSWFLLFLTTLSIGAKIDHVKWDLLADGPWIVALSPLITLLVLYGFLLLYITLLTMFRRYDLTWFQSASMLCYTLGLVCLAGGMLLLIFRPETVTIMDWETEVREEAPQVGIWIGIMLGCLGACIAMKGAIHRLVRTQGFEDPVPLSKTPRGWEPSCVRTIYWSFLGVVTIRTRSTQGKAGSKAPVIPFQQTHESAEEISSVDDDIEEDEEFFTLKRGYSGNYDDIGDNL
mmetsp:Transcript_138/g.204  ORF Transcript_138/g.204 Transcript_138/m.204 type:complete len:497 (-) Transcript_138:55-1545(-)|eukprot:CAMPEP_0171451614 /NCGR_PEP_ID=MMETSP0945-20130129/52_1 /TAXON_ID=109269 /ORGANISM="Vaucheria litorea, Strain CCMP2940" /LENGTH=496 /DNA_ID=CAMNT_0011976117 /DNA_START=46 /DNA_END=1536 /DNA_ORIENTATION=-